MRTAHGGFRAWRMRITIVIGTCIAMGMATYAWMPAFRERYHDVFWETCALSGTFLLLVWTNWARCFPLGSDEP